MPKCRILDDRYWEKIYQEMRYILSDREFPIKTNILSPMGYLSQIEPEDVIVLDNQFPLWCCVADLGTLFLQQYLERAMQNPIIAISEYGKKLIETDNAWDIADKKWNILAWMPEKDSFEIGAFLQAYLKQE